MEKTYALIKDSLVVNTVVVEEDNSDIINTIREINENPQIVEISSEQVVNINYTYDEERNAFISPQPYPSWTIDYSTLLWNSPVPYPERTSENIINYTWDEETLSWVEV
jgi:hypothetical protein